jgi:hypothetical protein
MSEKGASTSSVFGRACAFMDRLETFLNGTVPSHGAVADEFVSTNKRTDQSYEPRFFKKYIVPSVYRFLTDSEHYEPGNARKAVLAEGFADKVLHDFSSDTPASKLCYPYKKSIVATLRTAKTDWWATTPRLSQSCPDLALRSPCEHRIVFEGKLFRTGSVEMGRSAIVNGIFESFFYRGLPTLLSGKEQDGSGYDFGCFLAYDASPQGSLWTAWAKINGKVAQSCLEGLNVRVMVLRKE